MAHTMQKGAVLQPVPATVELGRLAATAMQAAKSGARVLGGRRNRRAPERAARELRNGFAALGPTYVKLGQLIASSPGVFPEIVSEEFRTLLDRVPPADPTAIDQVLQTELGAAPADVFGWFDPKPVASASIAQVHRARLVTGEDVVVKIQRPGIKMRLAADLQIMKRIAAGLELSAYGRMVNAPRSSRISKRPCAKSSTSRPRAAQWRNGLPPWRTHNSPSWYGSRRSTGGTPPPGC